MPSVSIYSTAVRLSYKITIDVVLGGKEHEQNRVSCCSC